MYINGKFTCYLLEDGHKEQKVYGETRVDGGIFKAMATHAGKIFESIRSWAKDMVFAIVVFGFPRHSAIMYHPGNNVIETKGCFLPGLSFGKYKDAARKGVHYTQDSRLAYRLIYDEFEKIYDRVAGKFTEEVEVRIYRENVSQLLSKSVASE